MPGGLVLLEATGWWDRLRGLGGLTALPPDVGLSLPESSIHTATVRFELDLLWRARDGTFLRLDEGVGRWRIRACKGAASVIETAAGSGANFLAALT